MSKRSSLRAIVKLVRPHQWVKNLFVFAPVFFARDLFTYQNGAPYLNLLVTGRAFVATLVFCLLAGAVYTVNDLADVEADRIHPVKRNRPIASGEVSVGKAKAVAAACVAFGLLGAYRLGLPVVVVSLVYLVENVIYTFRGKKIPFVDVSFIAVGFALRVLAGGFATDIPVSHYMLACTVLLALFLGFGKRRHELEGETAGKQRKALEGYTKRSLDIALAVTGIATAATYVAYTLDSEAKAFFRTEWLWLTSPFTIFGMVRFLMLVSGTAGRGQRAESPTQEMLSDGPFVLNLMAWTAIVVAIVYRLRPMP